ncbi:hypothetical protein ABLT31_29765 [Ammoniphilus sp. 3BR4]
MVSIVRQNLMIKGVVGSVPAHYETANRWLENSFVRVEPVITHTLGFEDAVKGIKLVKNKQAGKVMFRA